MEDRGEGAAFKKETVSKLLSMSFKDEKTRVGADAVILMAEMLKVFVQAFRLLVFTLLGHRRALVFCSWRERDVLQ
ncbi:centromere protein X isoform X2 [Amia ocellicauda]|uniref:centromere protein X isoform X2 n=1 Tax=Amia ocellicauda TaxID=2972642 RepID=UPI003463D700